MPLAAYVHLAQILSQSSNPEYIACHLFLLLDWNMVSRAESVVNAHIDLFGIYEDTLLMHFGPSKGDQEKVQSMPAIRGISILCPSLPILPQSVK